MDLQSSGNGLPNDSVQFNKLKRRRMFIGDIMWILYTLATVLFFTPLYVGTQGKALSFFKVIKLLNGKNKGSAFIITMLFVISVILLILNVIRFMTDNAARRDQIFALVFSGLTMGLTMVITVRTASVSGLTYLFLAQAVIWLVLLVMMIVFPSVTNVRYTENFFVVIGHMFRAFGRYCVRCVKAIGQFFVNLGKAIVNELVDFGRTLRFGDWKTRLSLVFMGAGNLFRGQIVRGGLFLALEVVFFWYMNRFGLYWLHMLKTLGELGPTEEMEYVPLLDDYIATVTYHDNSFKILLYGILTIVIILAFIIAWRLNIKNAYESQKIEEAGKKLPTIKDDIRSLIDEKFYKTLLAVPIVGITTFTVLPILFMIVVAFTNYDGAHDGYITNLFTWVGWQNFKTMLGLGNANGSYASVFGNMLGWTVIWAFFATFSCYFLGILVAMMINKKGIKLKKMWRTILVLTIAIPQFISLMYIAKMFDPSGLVNGFLLSHGWIDEPILFWGEKTLSRVMVILINIWVGIPYQMLIATGILMNIPEDQYESAKIDGATPVQQFIHITMPYMFFITGPYLLTSFTGNMNNFNVIYLLTAGGPTNSAATSAAGSAGYTDLLITWLFKITQGADASYYMASVLGILVFVVVAVITLIVYGVLPSNRNEEDMQ